MHGEQGQAAFLAGGVNDSQALRLPACRDQPRLCSRATAAAADPVFSSAFGGAPTAYRVDAKTDRYELGVNIALRGNNALDFGWSHFDSRADRGGGKYDGDSFRIGYLLRFR